MTIRFFISKYNTTQWYFKVKVHTRTDIHTHTSTHTRILGFIFLVQPRVLGYFFLLLSLPLICALFHPISKPTCRLSYPFLNCLHTYSATEFCSTQKKYFYFLSKLRKPKIWVKNFPPFCV